MKQMTIVVIGLLLMSFAVHAQAKKSHKHQMDSTKSEMKMEKPADVYVCPMHSDVKSDKPGKCSKCKMALVKQEPVKIQEANAIYTCPMHPDVNSDKPGKCPKCKMDLVKQASAKIKEAKAVYTCPMHPDVKSDGPGKCPKCKMALVPEKKSE